jgi:hypothetical protein
MLNCLLEKADDEFNELVWILQVGHMIRALQDEELRDPRLEKFVALYNLVCTNCA